MRKIAFLLGFSLLSLQSISQENQEQKKLDNSVREWTALAAETSLQFDYKFIDCDPEMGYNKELIVFRLENKSDQKIEVKWHMHLYYNGECKTCEFPEEYTYSVTLEPNEVITGDCAMNSDHRVTIFSKFLDERYTGGSQLTRFEVKNLNITTLK